MAFGSGSSLATDRWMRRGGLPSSAQALSVGRATWLHQHSSKKPTAHSGSAPATSISRSRRLFFFRTRGRGDAPPLSERVRIPDEPVDSCDGLRGGLRRGTHRRARLGGDGAGDAFAPARGSLDAGEAVDNLPQLLGALPVESVAGPLRARGLRLEGEKAPPVEVVDGVAHRLRGASEVQGDLRGALASGTGEEHLRSAHGESVFGAQTLLEAFALLFG